MKLLTKLLLPAILLTIAACKPSPQKAQDYYEEVSKPIESILKREDNLVQAVNNLMKKDSTGSPSILKKMDKTVDQNKINEVDMAFSNFQMQISTSTNQLKAIGEFDNSNVLKDAAIDLLGEYKSVSEKEYPDLISIAKIPDADYTEANDTRFFVLSDSIDNKLQRKVAQYIRQVKLFSQNYKFQLENDSIK
jgi:hypothetical protein